MRTLPISRIGVMRTRTHAVVILAFLASLVCPGLIPLLLAQDEPELFVVRVDGKQGFIDAKGDLVIAAKFQMAYPFSENLAAVQVGDKWGFIDSKGEIVIEPRFAMVGFFSDGLASFRTKFMNHWATSI